MQALACRDLSKLFGGRLALPPVSFSVEEGEHLAITGPSGSGKTTLLRLLAGVLEPSAGDVLQAGRVVSRRGWRTPPHERDLGVLFQGLALWPHLTVLRNVELGLRPRTGGGPGRRERWRLAEAALDEVGLLRLSRRYPSELSGGERERVAWARAVASAPGILLLDEPLTSLDPKLRDDLLDRVLRYRDMPGRTLVVVTHDRTLASKAGRRLLELALAG